MVNKLDECCTGYGDRGKERVSIKQGNLSYRGSGIQGRKRIEREREKERQRSLETWVYFRYN